MTERAQLLLELADDELILGWRNSEWTGIAPFLEEDVAFSSIAQNEIGHARALYELAGIAAKIEREEVYHRLHAEMWLDRLRNEQRYTEAVEELWPYALGVLEPVLRPALAERVGRPGVEAVERGAPGEEFAELWNEMTMVRRSAPVGAQW